MPSSNQVERVEELKREWEEYVKAYNPHQNDLNVIFRDWMFEKLARLIPTCDRPRTISTAELIARLNGAE